MKQLQVILTLDVSNDQYSELMNDSVSIETLALHALEADENYSLDFPAVIISKFANEQT